MPSTMPKLREDEAFFPLGKGRGRIIKLNELQRDGQTLVYINQCQAIREARKRGGFVLSLAEDWEALFYAKDHQEDPRLKRFYDGVSSDIEYARWTRTQVHNLRSKHPLVVNIVGVHPSYEFITQYEREIIEVPWLPRESGYIQELDRRTGLPRKLGHNPNPKFNGAFFSMAPDLDVAAVIRGGSSGLNLNLDRVLSFEVGRLGVRLAKNFSLEKRLT